MRLFAWPRRPSRDEIVAGKNGIDDLRDDAVFVAVDSRKQRFAALDGAEQVAPNFVLHGKRAGSAHRNQGCASVPQRCAAWNDLPNAVNYLLSWSPYPRVRETRQQLVQTLSSATRASTLTVYLV